MEAVFGIWSLLTRNHSNSFIISLCFSNFTRWQHFKTKYWVLTRVENRILGIFVEGVVTAILNWNAVETLNFKSWEYGIAYCHIKCIGENVPCFFGHPVVGNEIVLCTNYHLLINTGWQKIRAYIPKCTVYDLWPISFLWETL